MPGMMNSHDAAHVACHSGDMRQLLGAIGLQCGKGQPQPLFDGSARAPRRRDAAGMSQLSVGTVVSDLQSELRRRRRGRAASGYGVRPDTSV
jgi:hypothetical protein